MRLLHHCGMALEEVDICCGRGHIINQIIRECEAGWDAGVLRDSHETLSWNALHRLACNSSIENEDCTLHATTCTCLRPAAKCRSTLFTGSKRVAEKLAEGLRGRASSLHSQTRGHEEARPAAGDLRMQREGPEEAEEAAWSPSML